VDEQSAATAVFSALLDGSGWSVSAQRYEPESGHLSVFITHAKSQVEKELRVGFDQLMLAEANVQLFMDSMSAFIDQATSRLGGRVWVHGETR
jgi:hypothetical protein